MALKGGLGKGLDALLGDYTQSPAGVQEVDVNLLDTNLQQPRKNFDEEKLNELSGSIKRHGMVQPIIVKQNGERYTIVAGERRYRAARLAGLKTVPVVVKDMPDADVMEVALIENIQREDLNPIEEAAAIRFLMQQHDLTQEEVAARLSKSRPAVANSLRLLALPDAVQDMLREGLIQAGHARAIASIHSKSGQLELAKAIAEGGLSVREAESRAKAMAEGKARPARKNPPLADSDLAAAEESIRNVLGTRVSIRGSASRGKIVIEYYSKEDLERIYELLTE